MSISAFRSRHVTGFTLMLLVAALGGCSQGPSRELNYHPADKDISAPADQYAANQISISQLQAFQQRMGSWNQHYHTQLTALHQQQIQQVHQRGLRLHALRDDQSLGLEQHNLLQALAYQAHLGSAETLERQQMLVKQYMTLEVRQRVKALAWAEDLIQRQQLAEQLLALHYGHYSDTLTDIILGFEPETSRPQPPELVYPAVPPAEHINNAVNPVQLIDDYERTMTERSRYLDQLTDYLQRPLAYSRLNPDQAFRTQMLSHELAQAGMSEQTFFQLTDRQVQTSVP